MRLLTRAMSRVAAVARLKVRAGAQLAAAGGRRAVAGALPVLLAVLAAVAAPA